VNYLGREFWREEPLSNAEQNKNEMTIAAS
jgi:hypothetical protein